MKTDVPPRAAVPFPPIRQAVCCPGRQQEPQRTQRKKVQPPPPQDFSHSWPKAGFQLGGRRPQPRLLEPRLTGSSCASVLASARYSDCTGQPGGSEGECFSLSLTPEAVQVIQKRSLERQQLAGRIKEKAATQCPAAPPSSDIRKLLKISLLNDQHKYDDVEYEECGGPPDRSVLQKCLQWLEGVESARGPVGKLARLPQLANSTS